MNIGNRVEQLRRAKNMKIAELAEAIGGCRKHLSSGDWRSKTEFTEQTLSRLADCLGVDIAELFTSDPKSNAM